MRPKQSSLSPAPLRARENSWLCLGVLADFQKQIVGNRWGKVKASHNPAFFHQRRLRQVCLWRKAKEVWNVGVFPKAALFVARRLALSHPLFFERR